MTSTRRVIFTDCVNYGSTPPESFWFAQAVVCLLSGDEAGYAEAIGYAAGWAEFHQRYRAHQGAA